MALLSTCSDQVTLYILPYRQQHWNALLLNWRFTSIQLRKKKLFNTDILFSEVYHNFTKQNKTKRQVSKTAVYRVSVLVLTSVSGFGIGILGKDSQAHPSQPHTFRWLVSELLCNNNFLQAPVIFWEPIWFVQQSKHFFFYHVAFFFLKKHWSETDYAFGSKPNFLRSLLPEEHWRHHRAYEMLQWILV